ncbi:hypothetical protein [Jeongeupia chitinilytica]|uniref:Yip1 domain-containing protein n=1 Tax=Jeongeupia chitinilytica TaxID=1041641 RepID=A0ABQ3H061_9NEIS|nr:hypothetical protein [Jeongeupia chitinilytica]GHD63012.1 hypothetical protein GCM10007350_19580 [Jeongeupia chitinilytica]
MQALLRDAIDLARLRVEPLAHYRYPVWQPLAWLALLSTAAALGAHDFDAPLLAKVVFFAALDLLSTIVSTLWLMGWLRLLDRKPLEYSLFPLVVLAATPQLLQPLAALLDGDAELVATVVLTLYGLVVLVRAVAVATAHRPGQIVAGLLAYLPLALLQYGLAVQMATFFGWIVPEAPK